METLDLVDFLLIAEAVTGVDSGRLADLCDIAAAEFALAAPRAAFAAVELYPERHVKAAILCSRLVRARPLPESNELVAYVCMVELVQRNGARWAPTATLEEQVETIELLAAGRLSEDHFAAWVQRQIAGGA